MIVNLYYNVVVVICFQIVSLVRSITSGRTRIHFDILVVICFQIVSLVRSITSFAWFHKKAAKL